MKYRLTMGKHTRFENGKTVRYTAGAIFEATEAEVKAFGDRLEAVPEAQPEEEKAPPAGEIPAVSVETETAIGEGEQIGGFLGEEESEPVRTAEEAEPQAPAEVALDEPAPFDLLKLVLPEKLVQALTAAEIDSFEKLASKMAEEPDGLAAIKGVGKAGARLIREAVTVQSENKEP